MDARRWNYLYKAVEEGEMPEGLTPEEQKIYNSLKKELEKEQAKVNERAEKNGVEPYKVRFEPVELETK